MTKGATSKRMAKKAKLAKKRPTRVRNASMTTVTEIMKRETKTSGMEMSDMTKSV